MKFVAFVAIAFLLLGMPALANTIYFPQWAVGSGYSTTFTIMNTGSTALTGQLRVFNQDGSQRSTPPEWENITISAAGSARFSLPNVGSLTVGSAYFQTNDTAQGVGTFELRADNGVLITTAGVIAGPANQRLEIPIDLTGSSNTGMALMNTQNSATNVRLRLISQSGTEVGTVMDSRLNPFPARRQIAEFVPSLFPNLQLANFSGTLIAETTDGTVAIAATGIAVKEGLLSSLPVITSFTSPGSTPGTGSGPVWVNLAFAGISSYSLTLQNRTITADGTYFFSLAPGTYEVSGQVSGLTQVLLRGGLTPDGGSTFGGVQASSITSVQGPTALTQPCDITYLGAGAVKFRFTVVSTSVNACQK